MTTELDAQRAITAAFISVAATSIVLTPQTKTKTGNGTTMVAGTPRTAQTFKMCEPGDSGRRLPTLTVDGKERDVDFLLLGVHDAVVANDDTFTYSGQEFFVAQVMPSNGYETRALVVRRGF